MKKHVFKKKRRTLGDDAYLVRAGLRCKKVIPLDKAKRSDEESKALKDAKKAHKRNVKMVTIVKTSCNG